VVEFAIKWGYEMKKVIFGTSVFSKLVKWYIEHDTDDRIDAFTVEKEYRKDTVFCGTPIIPFEELDNIGKPSEISVINTCGYHKMNDIRHKIFEMCLEKGYEIGSFIHPSACIKGAKLGLGNIILPDVLVSPYASIGNCNIIFNKTIIGHDCIVGNFNYFSGGVNTGGISMIGDHNFLGMNAVISDEIRVGSYNLIGAGAYVSRSVEEGGLLIVPQQSIAKKMKKSYLYALIQR